MIEVKNLVKKYGDHVAVDHLSFTVEEGHIYGFLGPNGAGKSTTMNMITGYIGPTEGSIMINGHDMLENPEEAKKYIGFLPQKPPLYNDLTVEEFLAFTANIRRIPTGEVAEAIKVVMGRCGLSHFRKRLVRNLSGGYQQRLGIAPAIIHNPAFVVLDEPTNGLDPNQIVEIRHLIKEIAEERTVILSTHILSEVQATCDKIKMIEHGHMIFSGTMEEFNNYVEPCSFLVTFGNPPAPEELKNIDGISEVEPLTLREYRVYFTAPAGITQQVIARSVEKGWQLEEICLERESLDTIFARLSKNSK